MMCRIAIVCACALALVSCSRAQEPADGAVFRVTGEVARPAALVPPLGANDYGGCGAVEWARNNFVHNAGNEPIYWQNLHRIMSVEDGWIEIDGPGTSWWELWGNGFLSGARARIYRIVDAQGQPINGPDGLDRLRADHVVLVGETRVLPEGSPGFPMGGWVVTSYGDVHPNSWIRGGNLSATDIQAENGTGYWYTVVAVDSSGETSEIAGEASVTPGEGEAAGPVILPSGDEDRFPAVVQGASVWFEPQVHGGTPPYTWEVAEGALPQGLVLDPEAGSISGEWTQIPTANSPITLRVTDAEGRSDVRTWHMNPSAPPEVAGPPEPPSSIEARTGDGMVHLTWEASPSADVVAYRIKRSTRPLAEQRDGVRLDADAPEVLPYDYLVLEKKFDPFRMRYVHPRVRGIGNPMDSPNWYWRARYGEVDFSLADHPEPVPAEMEEPGEACLRMDVSDGEAAIEQFVFIGTGIEGESIWYGQLQPGEDYRLEVWLRQEGVPGGQVRFQYGDPYPEIGTTFDVTGEWSKYTYDFSGPERPVDHWHFGHTFVVPGPGRLWMDNCRIFRVDGPEALEEPYVPNATVLDELMATQPANGPKAAHRCWVLARDATMDGILSWEANSQVRLDWSTSVNGTVEMPLPAALEFCRRTGDSPETRVVPWVVIQHVLHDEADWQNLVEFLAEPYDPGTDTPESKPWAYRRYQQRGTGGPWIDEFRELIIEFGNETWHNGVFDDWLGFATRNAVWQGGHEYGLFSAYLIDIIQSAPSWSEAMESKVRFALGDGYVRMEQPDGMELSYGEEAVRACPEADLMVRANYVGPKWETGDSSQNTFDDHGVQATLLAYLTTNNKDFERYTAAHEELGAEGVEYEIAAYESGPSGYTLPGSAGPEVVEVNEKYGKSLAMAVASLDAWLDAYHHGWTYQNFLGYAQGQYWSSHTWFSEGFRPSPGWQALQLRNRHARGDLLTVEAATVPTIDWSDGEYPLIGVYAFRDGDRWSVFVLSRALDGQHDGRDFGDGAIPVTLELPFDTAASVALHRLTGDPRGNNRDALNYEIESLEVPAATASGGTFRVGAETGGMAGGMPPGSIYLYVFEGAE